nr:hypothetical protein [Kibdelosporangium sp. MJ126-NF4]
MTVALGAAVVSMMAFSASAQAEPALSGSADSQVVQKKFSSEDFKKASMAARDVAASDAKTQGHVKEHLDDAARNGRLLDESEVMVAQLPDPVMPGNSITLAWDKDRSPDSLLYAHRKSTDPNKGEGLAVELQMSKPQAPPGAASPDVRGGSGYEAAFQITNLIRGDEGCSTGWFAPTYTADRDHKIVSCYQVLELDKTPIFIYNRWSLWTPADPYFYPFTNVKTLDFDVRSRPWKGKENLISQLTDWAPRSADMISNCDTKTEYTLQAAAGPITGSAKIPTNTCKDYRVDVTAGPGTSNTIAVNYIAGSWFNAREKQMYIDVAGKYAAIDAVVNPIWADYNYMEVGICTRPTCVVSGADEKERWVKKDTGWSG